jgi:monofunctional glycosyltransferase
LPRTVARKPAIRSKAKKRSRWPRVLLWIAGVTIVSCYTLAIGILFCLKWIDPPTTALQIERRIASWFESGPYRKQYEFVPVSRISPDLEHAVIAAEDARFYQHSGFDWKQVQRAVTEDVEGKRLRGASTIDQQVVKNLFFGTSRSFLRKAAEASLVPFAEFVLGKRRILELYLNIVEWGSGVYGAEAAAQMYYHCPASRLGREQSARLAAMLPAPRRRKPSTVTRYSAIILERMRQMNW